MPLKYAYRLSRYRNGDAIVKPRLNKMKGNGWLKQQEKVKRSTEEIALEVIAGYARRDMVKRMPYREDLEGIIDEFGASFKYEPTVDQKRCFDEVKDDMVSSQRPMDRLVAGDVGFGKTEVAMRALFRCVINKRQSVLLAPTTVLAVQHYRNLKERFSQFGIEVKLLRGGNRSENVSIKEGLKEGSVGMVVGTHALLSKGVTFRNLGLVVIDEEQRFGVKQKERLKVTSEGCDVLTLSATPIPRTLQMSLSGVRDTSTIRTPPPMRVPVKTKVTEFNLAVVKNAIQEELERGGQCCECCHLFVECLCCRLSAYLIRLTRAGSPTLTFPSFL